MEKAMCVKIEDDVRKIPPPAQFERENLFHISM